ncbi:MAG: superoxide dismutase [Bacteroidales bacterium]
MKKFELPVLPYAADALAPIISEQTILFHYGKHLQTYINNLNNLIIGTEFENMPLEEIIKHSSGGIFNNAAQTFNHQFYFNTFSKTPKTVSTGKLLTAIEKQWGTLDNFKKEFAAAGTGIFGSGWVWLAKDTNGNLSIIKAANADNPFTQGLIPLLCFDVWEHAYYLDYQNRRADQLNDLWKITDWSVIEERYESK